MSALLLEYESQLTLVYRPGIDKSHVAGYSIPTRNISTTQKQRAASIEAARTMSFSRLGVVSVPSHKNNLGCRLSGSVRGCSLSSCRIGAQPPVCLLSARPR